MNRIIILISVLFFACQTPVKKEEPTFNQLTNLIDKYAENSLENGNINSLAVAIYKDGQVYHNYYGSILNQSTQKPNDNSQYEIASISKVFVGSLIAQAVLDHKIKLDDDIRIYLNGDYPNLEFQGTPISIKNLLTHTLGFKNRKPKKLEDVENKISDGFYENKTIEYKFDDFLEELKTVELDKKPGTIYRYNSIGPELLAYILEQVYNDSFESILSRFLNEIDMKETFLQSSQNHQSQNLIQGYRENGELAPRNKSVLLGGGGGMISTLPDLIKFMKFQLESNHPLIKESTKKLYENDDEDILGYLWEVDVAEEEGFYYLKSGTSYGIQSVVLICPDTDYGLILLANNTSEKAILDWMILYNKIESDLIKYPKINLVSLLNDELKTKPEQATIKFNLLVKETKKYYSSSQELNLIGYELLNENKVKEAIVVFKLLVSAYPNEFNGFDSLGEAYYENNDFTNALINYKKSLELNPDNNNAEEYISIIKQKIN